MDLSASLFSPAFSKPQTAGEALGLASGDALLEGMGLPPGAQAARSFQPPSFPP